MSTITSAHTTPASRMRRYWDVVQTRSRYYVPVLRWLPRYDIHTDLVPDMLAGVTVALLLIPQSLSYASGLARLDPVYGLYASFIPVLIYGLLGTSRQLAVGPEALVSLLVGGAVSSTTGHGAPMGERVGMVVVLSLMVGIITFALGIARLGFLDSVLSRALLRGFITAVACVILIEQMPPLLGMSAGSDDAAEEESSPFSKLLNVLEHLDHINWVTCVVSACSVSFLFGFGRVKAWLVARASHCAPLASKVSPLRPADSEHDSLLAGRSNSAASTGRHHQQQQHRPSSLPLHVRILVYVPEILIVVAGTILASFVFELNGKHAVQILGDDALQTGFHAPTLPRLTNAYLKALLTPAILISVLGFVESIVCAKNFGSKYSYPVSANRELVAFGCINLVGSMLNCFPTFASIARSQVNDTAGARTQLAGVITGLIILLTILFILPVFYFLPRCVMASIVVVAAAALLEFEDMHFMWKIRAWSDILLMLLTFCITIFWSVEAGTLISIGMSLILVIQHSTKPKISILGKVVETLDDGNGNPDDVGGDDSTPHGTTGGKIKYKPLHEIFQHPEHHHMNSEDQEVLIVKVEESLFFANTGQMKDRLRRAEAYGGWLHIHPSEEERRPIVNASVMASGKQRSAWSPSETRLDMSSSFTAGISPPVSGGSAAGPVATEQYADGSPVTEEQLSPANFERFDTSTAQRLTNLQSSSIHRAESTTAPPQLRAVIFDIENMPHIDASAIQILSEIVEEYHRRAVSVCFVKLRESNKSIFLRSGLLGEIVGSDHFFRKISDALLFLRENWYWQEVKADGGVEAPAVGDEQQIASGSSLRTSTAAPPTTSFSAYNLL